MKDDRQRYHCSACGSIVVRYDPETPSFFCVRCARIAGVDRECFSPLAWESIFPPPWEETLAMFWQSGPGSPVDNGTPRNSWDTPEWLKDLAKATPTDPPFIGPPPDIEIDPDGNIVPRALSLSSLLPDRRRPE